MPGIVLRLRLCELHDTELRPKCKSVIIIADIYQALPIMLFLLYIISFNLHCSPTRQRLGLFCLSRRQDTDQGYKLSHYHWELL